MNRAMDRARRNAPVSTAALLAALSCGTAPAFAAGTADIARGQALFNGAAPLRGTIHGHQSALPAHAARCVNCHAPGSSSANVPPGSAAPANTSFAPLLTAAYLTGPVARRGGPPSRYDEAAFCRALRTGIDPAYVIVSRSMPRYALSDADCGALWQHLTASRP